MASGGRRMDGKTIVFAVTKRHAETLAQMLDEEFADKKPAARGPLRRLRRLRHGGRRTRSTARPRSSGSRRRSSRRSWSRVNMLDTGFDCPEVVNLVMARFTKSAILYQQMRGRGTRRADHIKKVDFTIFDFVGNTDFHGDSEERPEGGFVIVAKPPKEPTQAAGGCWSSTSTTTSTRPRATGSRSTIRAARRGRPRWRRGAHELGLRFEAWLLEQERGAATRSACCA